MAPHEESITTKTESVIRHDHDELMKPKTTKVSIKQWQTTASDPARLHRLMPQGYTEPLRAAPKLGDVVAYGGRFLYPHEAVAAQREPSPEPEKPVRQHLPNANRHHYQGCSRVVKPQPLKTHYQHEKLSSGSTGVREQDESVTAWRDCAANPKLPKVHEQSQKISNGPIQRQYVTDSSFETIREQTENVQSDKPSERERVYVRNPGPRVVHDGQWKVNEQVQSDTFQAVNHSESSNMQQEHMTQVGPLGRQRQPEKNPERDLSNGGSEPVAPAPMRSPDLKEMQIPRPNRNYVASVRSMVSVLSLDEDDNARGDTHPEESPMKHSDIRSKIGLEHNLHISGGKLINTDIWAEKARSPDEIFLDPVYANPWIEDYVENQTDYDVRANFLYEEDSIVHCHSDVDTFSGKLLKPIQHDYTAPDYMNSESLDRQLNRTASLYVQKKAIKANARNNNSSAPPRRPRGWFDTPTPLDTATAEHTVPKPAQPVERARADSEPDPFSPRVPCHVRPARMEDMDGVRGIYNWEVLNGLQALDTEPLSLDDWEGILKKTQDAELPFVVVIGGPYQLRGNSSQAHTEQALQDKDAGKVLAFGFLTIRQPGLAGSFGGTSRMSAKAHVFVHHDYRRKKLGHVCIDKLLSTVSTRYSTKDGYEFVNINDNPTYKYPWQHNRKIYSVFVEYFVPRTRDRLAAKFAPDDTDLQLFERIMNSRYGFWKAARLEGAHRSRRTYEPHPIWLDTVMFEHMCQEGLGFTQVL
ncbi:hypothetical protein BR93DRAFT_941555 [Coniochaeta sp. PMI_546]|nr:hypothetical protein BR93DRAFT_941555 [Coniochaeta sp. PMI_546]